MAAGIPELLARPNARDDLGQRSDPGPAQRAGQTQSLTAQRDASIARGDLARLTASKAVANTSLRWLPFFLPTLALAFDTKTSTLAVLLGVAEASGLATLLAGRWLDRGHERLVIALALLVVGAGCLIALVGSVPAFAATALLVGGGTGYVTVGGHAWISSRVPFERRARFIGIYEMSWASALLVGAPIVAVLISLFGWRGPFISLAIAAVIASAMVWLIDEGPPHEPAPTTVAIATAPTRHAWTVIAASAAIAMAGLSLIVVAGTWLDDGLGVSTSGIGLVAMAFGAAELTASASSSAFADRLGKFRTVRVTVALLLAGVLIVSVAGTSLVVGAIGLVIFFVSFEYSIVTSFSLVSEAMPNARGRTLGLSNAVSTVARGAGVISAGLLYEHYEIKGPALLSGVAAAIALVLLGVAARTSPLAERGDRPVG